MNKVVFYLNLKDLPMGLISLSLLSLQGPLDALANLVDPDKHKQKS